MIACTAPATGTGFLSSTLAHLDCQAQNIGEAGYQALASPGSPVSFGVTALLAIFVGIIGLRYVTGRPLGVDEWVASALKIGFVLALTASWPAYRTVVYDVVLKGPAEISSSIGRASALPGGDSGLAARLQGVDNAIMTLVVVGSGRLDVSATRANGEVAPPIGDDTALGWGKTLFVSSIIGSFGMLRLAGGLFLALAPLFAGFLLFETTRFLFFGWLRSLIAVALGSLGLAVVLGVQLAIIEPWLAQVLALRAAKVAALSAPFELLALTLSFSLALLGMFVFALRISFASPVITKVQTVIQRAAIGLQNETAIWRSSPTELSDNLGERTRAQMIAQSLQQTVRRDAPLSSFSGGGSVPLNRDPLSASAVSRQNASVHIPLGRSYHTPSRRIGAQRLNRKPTV